MMAAGDMIRSGWDDVGKLILRVAVAALLAFHGIAKLRGGIGWMAGMLQSHHLPSWLGYGTYVAEVVCPILLILGILTRPAALVVAFDLFMAIALVKRANTFKPQPQAGGGLGAELELLFLCAAVAIFFFGSGRFAVARGNGRWD